MDYVKVAAEILGVTERSVKNKICGKTHWYLWEIGKLEVTKKIPHEVMKRWVSYDMTWWRTKDV